MYTQLRSYLGEGVVGGAVTRNDDEGVRSGRLIVRVLLAPGAPMPPIETIGNSYVVDWRQLRRWSLSESRLPAGTEVLFREPTAWQRYRVLILMALSVMVAELVLIARLLVERRERRRAEQVAAEQRQRADETRRQVAHMGRVAFVGELAATIAHELRQPLAAIRANAEVGVKLTTRAIREPVTGEPEICRDLFTDILRDDDQAAEIVTRVRALLRREELPREVVDLNDACRAAVRLLQDEAHSRGAVLVLSLDPSSPSAVGDPVQFQQIVINLTSNALDAAGSSSAPRVTIRTAADGDTAEIVVEDNGPGLAPEVRERLFESFFTTKAQGLGLGLVIVQSIAERYQGGVEAFDRDGGGTAFRVTLPRAEGAQRLTDRPPADGGAVTSERTPR
jgi:signal transduction histidine kinase